MALGLQLCDRAKLNSTLKCRTRSTDRGKTVASNADAVSLNDRYRSTTTSRSGKEDNSCLTRSSEMSSLALLQSLKESILSQANVKAIYGEPIAAHGKTVIPVAKIMYG